MNKSGIQEAAIKLRKKGCSPECVSESSSFKRKVKNASKSPRNNNIEDLMQQFLVMKNMNNGSDLANKYAKEGVVATNLSKEQANSILNISSQGSTNMSFIN